MRECTRSKGEKCCYKTGDCDNPPKYEWVARSGNVHLRCEDHAGSAVIGPGEIMRARIKP